MTSIPLPPFSARTRQGKRWIDADFPESARIGLLHLLSDAVDRDYVPGWVCIAKELGRIARMSPKDYDRSTIQDLKKARFDAEVHLNQLSWERVYDFCERLHSHLAQTIEYERYGEAVIITKAQSQQYLAEELQRLFEEEGLGYEFRNGVVQRRGKRHTNHQINRAERALSENNLDAARKHFSKALRYFRDREKPDPENAVKEAVCAVEAAAKELFPDANAATLGDFVKWATGNQPSLLPKTIGQTFSGLYAFRNGGEGVSHGATSGAAVTTELAEYVLGIAASQILLLADLEVGEEEPPF